MQTNAVRVKTGEFLCIERHDPEHFGLTADNARLRDFIIQPDHPWFSHPEREWVRQILRGDHVPTSFDAFFVGRPAAGDIVASAWYATHVDSPQVGIVGYVVTLASHEGKGINSALIETAVEHFESRGGRMLYLGTNDPAAAHVYWKVGFRKYNGHVMRMNTSGEDAATVDAEYFAPAGAPIVREATRGDYARLTALYVSRDTWFTRDFRERLFNDPAHEQERCNSCWTAIALRSDWPGSAQMVMESGSGAIVGAAVVTNQRAPALSHVSELEFLVHPAHLEYAKELLEALLQRIRRDDTTLVLCYTASCDEKKIELLCEMGFLEAGRVKGYFTINDSAHDLLILATDVSDLSGQSEDARNHLFGFAGRLYSWR